MAAPKISDASFIQLYEELGPLELSRRIKSAPQTVHRRRRNLENKHGRSINGPNGKIKREDFPGRLHLGIDNGVVLVGSDLHAWPGSAPPAFRAFITFIKDMRPQAIVMNGDVIDGASVSRHPPLGWERRPTVVEEIETAQERLHDIELAAPKKTEFFWPVGNHDARFSQWLATHAPEFAKVHGTKLADHFGERWKPCYSVWINDSVVVKHRCAGGIHATYNNTLRSGKTTICGHLHSLQVRPVTDYNGTRWGVDCGMLEEPYGPQFAYAEDNPRNWRSGFVVLTFRGGELRWPELARVCGPNQIEFRGEIKEV